MANPLVKIVLKVNTRLRLVEQGASAAQQGNTMARLVGQVVLIVQKVSTCHMVVTAIVGTAQQENTLIRMAGQHVKRAVQASIKIKMVKLVPAHVIIALLGDTRVLQEHHLVHPVVI